MVTSLGPLQDADALPWQESVKPTRHHQQERTHVPFSCHALVI